MLTGLIEIINKKTFLSEFSFGSPKIKIDAGEAEIADFAIIFGESAILFQLKERNSTEIRECSDEARWFKNKIEKTAKKQIKDSYNYFSGSNLSLKNFRGHTIDVTPATITKFHNVIVYKHDTLIALGLKHYLSKDIGFIHIFDSEDYQLICSALDTPCEILEYLQFRETILTDTRIMKPLTEKNILGIFIQFPTIDALISDLKMSKDRQPEILYVDLENNVDKLIRNGYEINDILQSLYERAYTPNAQTDYYKVLVELAKLNRTERSKFKERWGKCCSHVLNKGDFILPFRLTSTQSNCGFIFIPLESKYFRSRFKCLINLTTLSKYEQRLNKHVGIVFCSHNNDVYIDYCLINSLWEHDVKLAEFLRNNHPFRQLEHNEIPRYELDNNK